NKFFRRSRTSTDAPRLFSNPQDTSADPPRPSRNQRAHVRNPKRPFQDRQFTSRTPRTPRAPHPPRLPRLLRSPPPSILARASVSTTSSTPPKLECSRYPCTASRTTSSTLLPRI